MSGNGNGHPHKDHQLAARCEQFDGSVGFEIIPDGTALTVFAYVGTRKFELTVTREELKSLAEYFLKQADQ